MRAVQVHPGEISPVLAKLYQTSEKDFAQTLAQLTAAWLVRDEHGKVAGAIGLRPSPAHGLEVMGGAFPDAEQDRAAQALIQAARTYQPQLYAYADSAFLPLAALKAVGFRYAGAYTRMTGPLPTQVPESSNGFNLVPLSEVGHSQDRLAAQRMYSDRIGHTHVPDDAGQPGFLGSDDALGRLAYDPSGRPAGLCRGWLDGETLAVGAPSVRPDFRNTGLRRALLLSICQAARIVGAMQLEMDAWGDTRAERAEDEALGLGVEVETPILMA